ncbi:MAG: MFS transporter [Candidatus Saccharicenans sp.]|nr:MAG: hypothetical protein C0168_01700 [Candidatus Aminicenantes bacterium]HEK86814.1 MFS transporter [Candidatus Aminicenantes bacterium]
MKSQNLESTKEKKSLNNALTTACSAGMFVFGIVMAILGAILPELFKTLQLRRVDAGNLFFFMNLSMLLTTLFFGPVVDRFGFRIFLLLSSLVVGLSFTGLAFSSSYSGILISVIFLGLAGAGLNGGTNALVNDIHPENRAAALNFLGIFFGFGALLIPLLIGALLRLAGIKPIILVAAVFSLLPFILFLLLDFPQPKQPQSFPLKDLKKIAGSGVLWLGAFILFFQSGNEFSVGGWLSSFFQEKFNLGGSGSALVLSGYWLLLMVGRLSFSKFLTGIKREKVIIGGAFLSFLALLGMIFVTEKIPAIFFALFLGLGFSVIYPTTLSIIGENFSNYSGTAFSLAIGTGLVGGMLSPWLIGQASQHYSLSQALFIPAFNLLMIMGLSSWLYFKFLKKAN